MLGAKILSRANLKFQKHITFKKQLLWFSFNSQTPTSFLQMAEAVADVSVHVWFGISVSRLVREDVTLAQHFVIACAEI